MKALGSFKAFPEETSPTDLQEATFTGPARREGSSSLNIWKEMPSTSCRMVSGGRNVLWTLCFLLLLLEVSSAKNIWKRASHMRLAEKSHGKEAGGSQQPRADRCPPPPHLLPPDACQAARCQADSECPRHRRCCYNGCVYACLEAVPPPPVLDWLVQPKPRWLGGNGWLLDGPEEVLQAEACSTTEDGAEPLLCPSGYECHILNPGDITKGIPNHGQCVKQRQQADGRFLRHTLYKEYSEGDFKNVAEHGKGQQRHLQ
ncbi:PREDICTED: WAP four-disulfide core domain protein 1 isoform X2 [Hipposideros armiger]|uniref:WAP four-disulfide core domain protein 1 n=1 Tax=Hipposideros armiger TaxID=186990 RepID=A0A8B7QPM2_HIPAR|nr:PREDICTED: WAP four-disulfide core domain protein 1 isoform X2 [Hipposideros armiger]